MVFIKHPSVPKYNTNFVVEVITDTLVLTQFK